MDQNCLEKQPSDYVALVEKTTLDPDASRKKVPELEDDVWVYRYRHRERGWILSVATYGEPRSHKLSLGGFRIAPQSRIDRVARLEGAYDNDVEAIELAIGMEGKVARSRLVRAGGPLGKTHLDRVVGGKCVLQPSDDARVGGPLDFELLRFAAYGLNDVVASGGVNPVTGQDLGHGVMSDGKTQSLEFLHQHYKGSVLADTSVPTAEGNVAILHGVLRALGMDFSDAVIGFIGCGNVGGHVLERVIAAGGKTLAIEANPEKREALQRRHGIEIWDSSHKAAFLEMPMDALVVNANGGTLDPETVRVLAANPRLKVVCGCENLTMPDPEGETVLLRARKIYCHTELCGMFGYLTAVEEFLSKKSKREAGETFDVAHMTMQMAQAADMLEQPGFRGAALILERDFALDMETALSEIYGN